MRFRLLAVAFITVCSVAPLPAQSDPVQITDLLMSNHTGNSMVISWRTSRPTTDNVVLYGKNSAALDKVMGDSTLPGKPTVVHYVQLLYLDQNATYYYKVRSDGKEYAVSPTELDSVRTFSQMISLDQILLIGRVTGSPGDQPLERVLVRSYLKSIRTGLDGSTIVDSTMWFTTLTGVDGVFQHNVANYRKSNGGLFSYRPGQTWMTVQLLRTVAGGISSSALLTATSSSGFQDLGNLPMANEQAILHGRISAVSPVRAGEPCASVVRLTLYDRKRDPLPGRTLQIQAVPESGVRIIQPSAPTDSKGQAFGLVYSSVAEKKNIRFYIDGSQDSLALDSACVADFIPLSDSTAKDTAAPVLLSVNDYGNTSGTSGPYVIKAGAVDNFPLSARLFWSVEGGVSNSIDMLNTPGTTEYSASIPGQSAGSKINYFVDISDTGRHTASSAFTFRVIPSGDLNADGKVDVFDLLALLKQLGNPGSGYRSGDLDSNGKVDVFDLLALLKKLAQAQ